MARPQNLEAAERKKIVAQLLARHASFASEVKGGVHFQAGGKGGGAYGILLNRNVNEGFVTGLLNSQILDAHLKKISSVYSSGYYSYADAYLKNLPIPPATETQQEKIAALTQTLTSTTADLRNFETAIEGFPDTVTAQRRSEGDVPDLEELSRVGDLQNLPREVRASGLSAMQDLSGQTVFKVGKGHMTFNLDLAEFVREMLKVRGKLSLEELVKIMVPERATDQHKYLETLRAWQARASELQGQLIELEGDLNDKVYEVYGLEDEREVIEGFLERF